MRGSFTISILVLFITSFPCLGKTLFHIVHLDSTDINHTKNSKNINCAITSSVYEEQANALIKKAELYQNTLTDSAVWYAQEAIMQANKYHLYHASAKAQGILGCVAWNKQYYTSAARYFFQSNFLYTQLADTLSMADSYIQKGYVHLEKKQLNEAQYFFEQAHTLYETKISGIGKIDSEIALGALYFHKEDYEKSSQYVNQALVAAQREAYPEGEMNALFLAGQQSLKLSDHQKAYNQLSKALKIEAQINNPYFRLNILTLIATASLSLQKETIAKELAFEAVVLSDKLKLSQRKLEALTVLSRVYERLQLFEEAYEVEKQRFVLRERIADENLESAIAEVTSNYLHRDKEISELQSYNEVLKTKQEVSHLYLMSVLILVLTICITIGFLYNRLRLKSKSNLLLSEKNKELLESNAALERYAYVASHDLKEPLRTISAFTSLIAQKYQPLLDDNGKKYMKFVTDGVAHMSYLLEDLLRYSKLINNKEFVQESVNLNQVVTSVEKALSYTIEERNGSIQFSEMPVIYSNSLHMHQLFQNLIANGLKFNDKPSPLVTINCTTEENRYLFSIKDNGIGIEEQYHKKIFEIFQRLSIKDYPGTGIGLSICQKIIEMNEGKLWLESKPGEGTTFFFYLPKAKAN